MKGKGIRSLAVVGLLVMAMVAMAIPAQARQELTATWQNTNALVYWTYYDFYYAYSSYCTTYCGYLLNWNWYGQYLDVPYKRAKDISSSQGTIRATETADYYGNLWGECVSFVKAVSHSIVTTPSWSRGGHVLDGGVVRGTAIAKFNTDGTYDSWGGTGHAAIFDQLYYENGVLRGIIVWDENWWQNGVVGWHVIRTTNSGTKSDASAYYAVLVP